MATQLIKMTFFASMITSLPLLADEMNELKRDRQSCYSYFKYKSSRDTVTQGVIGAEADEN